MEHVVIITHRQRHGKAKLQILRLHGALCVQKHAASLNLRYQTVSVPLYYAQYCQSLKG